MYIYLMYKYTHKDGKTRTPFKRDNFQEIIIHTHWNDGPIEVIP